MAPSPLREACFWLADALEQHWSSDQVLNRKHSAMISSLRRSCNDHNDDKHGVLSLMPALVSHVDEVIQKGQPEEFRTAVLYTLADSTREVPLWRPLFGLETKPNGVVNDNEMRGALPPDCIVEVARRIVCGTIQTSTSEQLRTALKIIANCCADNNVNRTIIIARDGIEAMLEMVRQGRECDLVIPTLYNVCVDYDEPARNAAGEPWVSLQEKVAAGAEADPGPAVNAAEQRLGTYWAPRERLTSLEILLRAKNHAKSPMATLADLIEMATRVALYGTQHFVHKVDGNVPNNLAEVNTTPDIVRSLLTYGVELAKEDIDCRVSICQAVLNVLSQPDTHQTVGGDFRMLWNLIHLPYTVNGLGSEMDDADEDEQALAPYQEVILKVVYSVSATETYQQISGSHSLLVRNCINALEVDRSRDLLASICVLLANSVVSKERAEQLIQSAPRIVNFLSNLITKISDSRVLLPAISLGTRLSLSPEGQVAFHKANMMSAISALLTSPTNQMDSIKLGIQRDAIVFVRLMIKGRVQYLPDLAFKREGSSHANIMTTIFSIFKKTNHTETKTEIGRLSVEMLRTLLSSTQQSAQSVIAVEPDEAGHVDHKKAESIFRSIFPPQTIASPSTASTPNPSRTTIADTISYIATQSINQPSNPQQPSSHSSRLQAEGEAWFGLALLSFFPSTHSSIKATLARDDFQLLKRLGEIAAQAPSSRPSPLLAKENDGDIKEVASIEHTSKTGKMEQQKCDPRYENIKVLIARMAQPQSLPHLQFQSLTLDSESAGPNTAQWQTEAGKRVQEGLEEAAVEMGLDWVLV